MSTFTFDIETDGFLDAMTVIHSLVIKELETGQRWSCHDHGGPGPTIAEGVAVLATGDIIVGHNVIKFDIPAIQKIFPAFKPKAVVRDTITLARLLWPEIAETDVLLVKKGRLPGNMKGNVALEAFGYRLGVWKGDYSKLMKSRGLDPWAHWNQEMQDYCEQDVEVTEALYKKALVRAEGFSLRSIELEHQVATILCRQEDHGFAFDVVGAQKLYSDLVKRRNELAEELTHIFPPWWMSEGRVTVGQTRQVKLKDDPWKPSGIRTINGKGGVREEPTYHVALYEEGTEHEKIKLVEFNPNSRDHIAGRLIKLRGWQPSTFTDGGKPKVDDDILSALPWPEAKRIAELLMVEKRIGQLAEGGQAWLKKEKAGRIHGRVNTNGAVTGRMTHSSPNVTGTPTNHAPYGERMRALFTASENALLVGCDADAIELRCLAGYMAIYDGGAYIEAVLKGDKSKGTDSHSINARALDLDPTKKYDHGGQQPTGRDIAKTWFYAFLYGAGDESLGLYLPGGLKRSSAQNTAMGKKARARFLAALPALNKLILAVKARVKTHGYLVGLDGRRIYTRSQHSALNTLLQGAGAAIMKEALVILDNDLHTAGLSHSWDKPEDWDYEFSANVHDEWQIDVKERHAATVGPLAADAIRKAGESFNFKCPLAGNFVVGKTWAETH